MNKHKQQLFLIAGMAAVMIGVQCLNAFSGGALGKSWGIWPRHFSGIYGVVFSPWLHGSWAHLWSNLFVFMLFSVLAIWGSTRRYIRVSLFIILGSGALVWLLGRNSIHVGASGWIFGLWAWLIVRAMFERSVKNILIALGLIFLYGGLLWGLFPKQGISVESHIAGAFCGVVAAWAGGKGGRARR